MRRLFSLPMVHLLLGLLAPVASAQEPLSFPQVMDAAVATDPETRLLRQEKEILEAAKVKAATFANPVLEADVTTGALTGSGDEQVVAIGAFQEFALWGKRGLRIKAAEAGIADADARLAARKRVIGSDLRRHYLEMERAEEQVRLASQAAELAGGLAKIAEARLEAGDIPAYELNLAKTELAAAESRRRSAEREVEKARREILVSAGLPFDTALAAIADASLPAEEEALSSAAVRVDLRQAETEKARAEAELFVARRDPLPDLTVGISYQREKSGLEVQQRTWKDTDNLIGFKVSMPIPVFNRGTAEIREATARLAGAEERRRLLAGKIEREVKSAWLNYREAKQNREQYEKEVLPPAKENVLLLHEAYSLGETGMTDVIQEQRKFLDILETYNELQQAERDAEVELRVVSGR